MSKTLFQPTLIGKIPPRSVPVYLRSGIASQLARLLPPRKGHPQVALVTESNVHRLYAKSVCGALTATGWRVDEFVHVPGEKLKTQRVISRLHEQWFERSYDRSTPIVALGGGTIGDAVGYAAATYMRGLPLWQVPTTIVGQVDSAIGGKVGINHACGKNLIGCFYHPEGIIVDPSLLSTLPVREIRSGLAEVVKYGIIRDPVLFRRCEQTLSSWVAGEATIDIDTIKRCIDIKLRVVEADERDIGLRHILNFGHTLGHAFEAWGRFRILRHGEAVTLGMVGVTWIAANRRLLSSRDCERILRACQVIAPALRLAPFESASLISYLVTDKKRQAGRNAWVFPVGIGEVTIVRDVTDKEIRGALTFVREWLQELRRGLRG